MGGPIGQANGVDDAATCRWEDLEQLLCVTKPTHSLEFDTGQPTLATASAYSCSQRRTSASTKGPADPSSRSSMSWSRHT